MKKIAAVILVCVGLCALLALTVPTPFGTQYCEAVNTILCGTAFIAMLVPGRRVGQILGIGSLVLVSYFGYALATGLVDVSSFAPELFRFNVLWVRGALLVAVMASLSRTPDSDLATYPVVMRFVAMNFIAWAFVPYSIA